ncbi:MAG: DUF2889 domain-containing protein [Comamonas sp.]
MPLIHPPANRKLVNMRDVRFRCYAREDDLWDVEAELIDLKTYDITLHGKRHVPAGTPIHHMWIRLTVNSSLVVQAVEAAMDDHPLAHCPEATRAMQRMVGCSMTRGWRKAINENLGGVEGCTHMRELIFNMATPAFHSVLNQFSTGDDGLPPRHLGQCHGWDFNGPGVAQLYPEFAGWQPLVQLDKAEAKI